MKKLFTIALFLVSFFSYSQEMSLENPVLKRGEATFTLTEVDDWGNTTIQYERCEGELIIETGEFFNKVRSGVWQQFDKRGNLIAEVKYSGGEKIWRKHYNAERPVKIVYEEGKPVRVTYELATN